MFKLIATTAALTFQYLKKACTLCVKCSTARWLVRERGAARDGISGLRVEGGVPYVRCWNHRKPGVSKRKSCGRLEVHSALCRIPPRVHGLLRFGQQGLDGERLSAGPLCRRSTLIPVTRLENRPPCVITRGVSANSQCSVLRVHPAFAVLWIHVKLEDEYNSAQKGLAL